MLPYSQTSMLDAALRYARLGLAVTPLVPREKKPIFMNWPETATSDPAVVARWWKQTPDANIGIATGRKSGCFVFDVDPKHKGDETFEDLVHKHGRFPDTWQQITGSGGVHMFFRYPNFSVRNAVGLFPGIDIRGDGGQAVVPPSIHPDTGKAYEWDGLKEIEQVALAEAPLWLLEVLESKGHNKSPHLPVAEKIKHGVQHYTLLALAGMLRRVGLDREEIDATLQNVNRRRCEQPGPPANIAKIAESVCRYRPSDHDLITTSAKLWRMTRDQEIIKAKREARLGVKMVDGLEVYRAPVVNASCVIEKLLYRGVTILAGRPKSGKAQPLESSILTPTGWSTMGAIKPGDWVIGFNGLPVMVIQTHPQGIMPCYRVTMSDGSNTETTADHLWLLQTHYDRRAGSSGRVMSTEDVNKLLADDESRQTYLPVVSPVQYQAPLSEKPFIPPYVLGVLLGDGGFSQSRVSVTSGDAEVFANLESTIPNTVEMLKSTHPMTMSLRTRSRVPTDIYHAPMVTALRSLGLMGKRGNEKFIPPQYLLCSMSDRMNLLRGLMDTDGTIGKKGAITFCSTSRTLCEGVVELTRSLGGTARLRGRKSNCYMDGKKIPGKPSYETAIKLPVELGSPFSVNRKTSRWEALRSGQKKVPTRRIVSVEYTRDTDVKCITVDSEDGLYVTDDFIVTHNSYLVLQFALNVAHGTKAISKYDVLSPGKVLYLALEETQPRTTGRLQKLMATETPYLQNIKLVYEMQPLFQGGLEQLRNLIEKEAPTLVIIDTFLALVGEVRGDKNPMRAEYKEVSTLQKLAAEFQTTILLVHHTRKANIGETPLDSVAGTTGVTAAADAIWTLRKDQPGEFLLDITGRECEEDSLALKFSADRDCFGWHCTGAGADAKDGKAQTEILQFLQHEGPHSVKSIGAAVHVTYSDLRKCLYRLQDQGRVANDGKLIRLIEPKGSYGTPHNS